MLNKKIEEALNAQINAELWSAYLYLSMAAYAHANGNPGMGNWFEVQFQEEQDHAKIMFNYIIQRGGRVELKPIDAVPTTWESPLAVFEATLAHEQKVTSLINNLFALTTSENDYATQSMLKWFIDEQVEEEENAQNIIDKLKMIQGNGYGLLGGYGILVIPTQPTCLLSCLRGCVGIAGMLYPPIIIHPLIFCS